MQRINKKIMYDNMHLYELSIVVRAISWRDCYLFFNRTSKNKDKVALSYWGLSNAEQVSATATTTPGNRSSHSRSCFQPEGTRVFRKLATVKLGRDLISFEEGPNALHHTVPYYRWAEKWTGERRMGRIHNYGVRLPWAPKFAPSTRFILCQIRRQIGFVCETQLQRENPTTM